MDEIQAPGIILEDIQRQIAASHAVIAEISTRNPNVFYEVGVRHAVRPYSTVLIGANVQRTPFDLAPDRVLPYTLDAAGRPASVRDERAAVVRALRHAREATIDSPVFQLIDDLPTPQIDRLKTDVFRERAQYSVDLKRRLADARERGVEALRAEEAALGRLLADRLTKMGIRVGESGNATQS